MSLSDNAMEELLRLLQTNEPLWMKLTTDGREVLDLDNYERMFPRAGNLKNPGVRIEASRDSGLVLMNSMAFVDMFMDPMYQELLPSGSLIQDMTKGYPKITWVEYSEVEDKTPIHKLMYPLHIQRWKRCGIRYEFEMLVISSQNGQQMLFPKGGWELDESTKEATSRETIEEAGVLGNVKVRDMTTLYLNILGGDGLIVETDEDMKEFLLSLNVPLINMEMCLKNYVEFLSIYHAVCYTYGCLSILCDCFKHTRAPIGIQYMEACKTGITSMVTFLVDFGDQLQQLTSWR